MLHLETLDRQPDAAEVAGVDDHLVCVRSRRGSVWEGRYTARDEVAWHASQNPILATSLWELRAELVGIWQPADSLLLPMRHL